MDLKFSISQGSCSGANIFTCYCSLIKDLVPLSVTLAGFADDHSISKSFPAKCHISEENTINTRESDKTKFIMFGSRQMLKHANTSHLDFNCSLIQQSKLVKYLGGHLDSSLTFEEHIKQKSKAAMLLNFTKIKAIRPSLNTTTCNTLMLMLCISNALLYRITKKLLKIPKISKYMCIIGPQEA